MILRFKYAFTHKYYGDFATFLTFYKMPHAHNSLIYIFQAARHGKRRDFHHYCLRHTPGISLTASYSAVTMTLSILPPQGHDAH